MDELVGKIITDWSEQGIIDSTGTETYAKEPKFAKLLWGISRRPCGVIKKFLGFSRMSVTLSLLRDNL